MKTTVQFMESFNTEKERLVYMHKVAKTQAMRYTLITALDRIEDLEKQVELLRRGEFICVKCWLRKDAEPAIRSGIGDSGGDFCF